MILVYNYCRNSCAYFIFLVAKPAFRRRLFKRINFMLGVSRMRSKLNGAKV